MQSVLGTVFVVMCFAVILAVPVCIIKAALMVFGEKTTALISAGFWSLALMLGMGSGLVRLYREAKRECKWQK